MSDVKKVFWSNVNWHRVNKKMSWVYLVGGNTTGPVNKTANITLNTVQKIAEKLDISDYAILFEVFDE